ncbi:hypothetical protein HDV03_002303 [Kappamyces sp. JEL0829]|nr:hypothetical protein HDV03_002303 [Kappamyces sp. JEL0829]
MAAISSEVQPAQFLLAKGYITIKNTLYNKKRFAALCAPVTIEDIHALYDFLFINGDSDSPIRMDEKSIPLLGNISYAAVKGTPFLVLLNDDSKSDKPEFIHLDDLMDIQDEVALETACSLSLMMSKGDMRLQLRTSIEYQDWMSAFEAALQIIHAPHSKPAYRVSREYSLRNAIPANHSLPRAPRDRPQSYVRSYTDSSLPRQRPTGSWTGSLGTEGYVDAHPAPVSSYRLPAAQYMYGNVPEPQGTVMLTPVAEQVYQPAPAQPPQAVPSESTLATPADYAQAPPVPSKHTDADYDSDDEKPIARKSKNIQAMLGQ